MRVELRSRGNSTSIAVDTIELSEGVVGALTGENGTGKTTLLRIAAGSIRPHRGTVTVSRPVIAFTDIERQVHFRLTLTENHDYFTALYGLSPLSRRLTLEHLDRAGLANMANKKGSALSKGEKARLLFSIIDAHPCSSIIIDEPTNGVDEDGRRYLAEVVARKQASGAAGLVSTHDRDFMQTIGAIEYSADGNGGFRKV
jgi:ABC-type multidrug transport system ATPase subunit